MAAGRAAEVGARVLLLEKMGRVGIKLALTGKGRCNLTNSGELQDFIESYRHNGKFLYNVFSRFFNDDLIAFFKDRGLSTVEERGRRIFPASQRSQDVVRVLRDFISSQGVRVLIHTPARSIVVDGGRAVGVQTDSGIFHGRRVILATGGASYPQTGSSGEGFRMAERLGHSLQPIRPSLVPLEIEEPDVRDLQGLALKNVRVTLRAGGQKVGEEFGEMLFTHFGVSGPIILTLSGDAVDQIGRQKVELSIDFKPALSGEQVEARLIRELHAHHRKQISTILTHLLPQRLVPTNPMPTKSYDSFLIEELRDPELAAEYLSAAVEDGSVEQLLIALRAVVEAHGGVGAVAEKTQLSRQAMYKTLSAEGNPTLTTLLPILTAVDLNLTFAPLSKAAAI